MEKKEPKCHICGRKAPEIELISTKAIRVGVLDEIIKEYPTWSKEFSICSEHLNNFRSEYIRSLLKKERGELQELDENVIQSLHAHETLSANIEKTFEKTLSFGERLSDKIASFGGSWTFIITFFVILIAWMLVNTLLLATNPYDPFPFILLNLILSCLAAIQAPIIMMSQNRQENRDRDRNINDYQVNLKAELEIRQLHQKMDHLISHQWERLAEIQEIQMELMNEIREER
jgi:uncharacterized membrane protein